MSTAKAQKRLQLAFERLEAAARRLKDRDQSERSAVAELEMVRAELDKTLRDYAELGRRSQAASGRVDAAVLRLKAVIDA